MRISDWSSDVCSSDLTNELTITRYIDAAPETVWDVMVNRQEEWWCPKPWRAEFDVNERRPGGRNEVRMHGPEGEVHTHNGTYLAFDDGQRFVSTDAVQGDFEPAEDRKSVVAGKSVSVRVDLGGGRTNKKKKKK